MTKFGVAGNSLSFYNEGNSETTQAGSWCAARGIDFYEYSFGRGIRLTDKKAQEIGEAFGVAGVELTVHAPYYINFANPTDEMIEKSIGYVVNSAHKVRLMKGNRVVFHPASLGMFSREEALELAEFNIQKLAQTLQEEGLSDMIICPETMGKQGQIGTLKEVIRFCKLADFFYPCIDFGHLNARDQGNLKTKQNYNDILKEMLSELPRNKVEQMHVHFSKIEYGKMGEIRHLTFEDKVFGPEFEPLAEALIENNLHPYIVCESSETQAEDALYMKRAYAKILS